MSLPSWPNPALDATACLLPLPANLAPEAGLFDVSRIRGIVVETDRSDVRAVAYLLARELSARLGRFVRCSAPEGKPNPNDFHGAVGLTTETNKIYLGDEGYDLDVRKELVFISAPTARGLLRGAHSMLQIVTSDAEGGFVAPALRALDKPWLPWRCLQLDVSEALPPIEWLRRFVRVLAFLRFNALRLIEPRTRADGFAADSVLGLEMECRERGIELSRERSSGDESQPTPLRPLRLVRIVPLGVEPDKDVAVEEMIPDDGSALPTVESIHALKPDSIGDAGERRVVGMEAWLRWSAAIDKSLFERAFVTRLAAFAEVAWTGPFRRSFTDFRHRLGGFLLHLDSIGVDYDVPPPGGLPDVIELDEEIALELVPPCAGARVLYTLDGTEPGDAAAVFDRPLYVKDDCVLRVRTRLANGKTSAVISVPIQRRTPG